VYQYTHKDYKGTLKGKKSVMQRGKDGGTELVTLDSMIPEELANALKYKSKAKKDLGLDQMSEQEVLNTLKGLKASFRSSADMHPDEVQDTVEDSGSKEGASGGQKAYRQYFEKKLKQWKIKSPKDLSDKDKRKFFEEVDKGWKSQTEGAVRQADSVQKELVGVMQHVIKKLTPQIQKMDLSDRKQAVQLYGALLSMMTTYSQGSGPNYDRRKQYFPGDPTPEQQKWIKNAPDARLATIIKQALKSYPDVLKAFDEHKIDKKRWAATRQAQGNGYSSLADAAKVTGDQRYAGKGTKIWYAKKGMTRDLGMGPTYLLQKEPDLAAKIVPKSEADLKKNHVLLGEIGEKNVGKVIQMMQGESWSPKGQANSLLRKLGLGHTSMSVGDVIQIGSKLIMLDSFGAGGGGIKVLKGATRSKQAQKPKVPKLTPAIRNKVAREFKKAGLDGNGRFVKPERGYVAALDILSKYGIELGGVVDSHRFKGDKGSVSVDLAWSNKEDPFSPTPMTSMLALSFYKLDDDKYEVLAYLS